MSSSAELELEFSEEELEEEESWERSVNTAVVEISEQVDTLELLELMLEGKSFSCDEAAVLDMSETKKMVTVVLKALCAKEPYNNPRSFAGLQPRLFSLDPCGHHDEVSLVHTNDTQKVRLNGSLSKEPSFP